MAMKYKKLMIPLPVYENLKIKQIEMERVLKEILGKNKKIPLTKVLVAVSSKPVILDDFELHRLTKRRVFSI